MYDNLAPIGFPPDPGPAFPFVADQSVDTTHPGPRRRASDRVAQACMALVLDEIDYGMFLLDEGHKVQHANRAARNQLRCSGSLRMGGGELHATDPKQAVAWNAAIKAAAKQGLRRMVTVGHGDERIAVAIVPLPRAQPADEARVLLLLSRRKICEDLSVHGFARSHDLTSAESQVFQALCRGLEPAQIALDSGVALSTVRTQISSIRLKAQVASIRELVHRVAQLPPLVNALRDDAVLCA